MVSIVFYVLEMILITVINGLMKYRKLLLIRGNTFSDRAQLTSKTSSPFRTGYKIHSQRYSFGVIQSFDLHATEKKGKTFQRCNSQQKKGHSFKMHSTCATARLPLSQGGSLVSQLSLFGATSDLWLYLREHTFYPWLLMAYKKKKITSSSKSPLLIAFQSCLGAVWVWSLVDHEFVCTCVCVCGGEGG